MKYMKRLRWLGIGAGLLLASLLACYIVLGANTATISFADPGLQAAVLAATGGETGQVLRHKLGQITWLDASYHDIRDLNGIERLANLRGIDLSGNPLQSLAVLANLGGLEELTLQDCGLTDLAALGAGQLARLRRLFRLDLANNPDLAGLAALTSLPQLRSLSLRGSSIDQLDAVGQLVHLTTLDLRDCDLATLDLEPLGHLSALEELDLRDTGLADLTFLTRLSNLRTVNLRGNRAITDFQPLASLSGLRRLDASHTFIGAQLATLAGLRHLEDIDLRATGTVDLTVLASLMSRGALQDNPAAGRRASLDIRDNPVNLDPRLGPIGYDVLAPYWNAIGNRQPKHLPRVPNKEIIISEAMSANDGGLTDADGKHADWIELFNPGPTTVRLDGFFLSDDPTQPLRWQFPPETELAADSRLIVFASGKQPGPAGQLHAAFQLDAAGESLVLTHRNRHSLVDRLDLPALPRNVSYGVKPDGQATSFLTTSFLVPTPGADNATAIEYANVAFSHRSGFYDAAFDLELVASQPGCEIYYTLDGSVPDPANLGGRDAYRLRDADSLAFSWRQVRSYHYNGPIHITPRHLDTRDIAGIPTAVPLATEENLGWEPPQPDIPAGMVVRALAWAGQARGLVNSASYFIITDHSENFTLPVVSIVTDPSALFDYDVGLYVPGKSYYDNLDWEEIWRTQPANYHLRDLEIPVWLDFFEADGHQVLGLNAGLRMHGDWSRALVMKSLRLYARDTYDSQDRFNYAFFPSSLAADNLSPINDYKRLLLRSNQSGQRTFLADSFSNTWVADHVAVDLLHNRPAAHFINGEYWGLQHLNERFDEHWLASKYGLPPEEFSYLYATFGLVAHLRQGQPEAEERYAELMAFVRNQDLTDAASFDYLEKQIDLDSLIDYNMVRIFSGDMDGVNKHVIVWRRNGPLRPEAGPGLDGRWRWHTWDFDNALIFPFNDTMTYFANDRTLDAYSERPITYELDAEYHYTAPWVRDSDSTILLAGLLRNEAFRIRFVNRFADFMNSWYREDILTEGLENAMAQIPPLGHTRVIR